MSNLFFSLNATIPIFLTMVLGFFFKKIGLFDDSMLPKLNKFVFQFAIPAVLFSDLAPQDFYSVWDTKFVLFCFTATIISIMIAFLISLTLKEQALQGEFIQASYRSSAAILGIAFIQNIYGSSGMAPLMIIGSVPLYNIAAVIVLTVFGPQRSGLSKDVLRKTIRGIITNPIIIGILVGLLWSILRIPVPAILNKTVANVAALATPLGLMTMGAAFDFKKAFSEIRTVLIACILKLVGFVVIFLPIAVLLGFRESQLIAILVMLGSATTVSSYIMAKNMGHEGSLSSACVMLTTLGCSFTLTLALFILKSLNLI